jgi:hypothetical protein
MAQCTDCDARIEYKGNGSQRTFTFQFEYFETTDVRVAQYDEEKLEYVDLTYGTDWLFKNPTVIEFAAAPATDVVIYRCTDIDQMQATFFPGYSVKADDLNDDFNQLRLAIEESRCGIGSLKEEIKSLDDVYLNSINVDEGGDLVKSNSNLTIDDEHVATTQWIDNRYWDQCEETTYLADTWKNEIDDAHIPTTGAVEARLVEIIRKGGFGLPSVVSVNGKAGVVSLGLGDLTDVETGTAGHIPTNGQALVWDAGMNHWMPGTVAVDSGIPEAPDDGRQYGRQNDAWTEIVSTGGGGGDSGLWQQSGNALEPVDGAEDLVIPGSITADGNVTTSSSVFATGGVQSGAVSTGSAGQAGVKLVNDGSIVTQKSTSGTCFEVYNSTDKTINLDSSGSASFAGSITAKGYSMAQLPALPA